MAPSAASSSFIDRDEVAALCRKHGVSRLLLFGSALTHRFDPERSDIDLLVEFSPDVRSRFDAFFGLREDLEALFGQRIDLVVESAVENPHFARAAVAQSLELYAA